jgi:murein DD-endopeptidase MepM/ murein hydrolase activator NlpD
MLINYALVIFAASLLTGCASKNHTPAPVVFKGDTASKTDTSTTQDPYLSAPLGLENEVDVSNDILNDDTTPQVHTVTDGESLLTISNIYQSEIAALIKANSLKPPYHLVPGQKLLIPKGMGGNQPFGANTSVQVDELAAPTLEDDPTKKASIPGTQPGTNVPFGMTSSLGDTTAMQSPADDHLPPLVRDLKTRHQKISDSAAAQKKRKVETADELLSQDADLPPAPKAETKPAPTKAKRETAKAAPTEERSTGVDTLPLAPKNTQAASTPAAPQPELTSEAEETLVAEAPEVPQAPTSLPTQVQEATGPVSVTAPPAPSASSPTPTTATDGFIRPIEGGEMILGFGVHEGSFNEGINITADKGTPIRAIADGTVAYRGSELRGFGNLVLVKHADNWISAYAHADQIMVQRGDAVKQGQAIATVGATGNVKTPQLHFELRRGNTSVDPMKHLK